jgi:hypothetical protein
LAFIHGLHAGSTTIAARGRSEQRYALEADRFQRGRFLVEAVDGGLAIHRVNLA